MFANQDNKVNKDVYGSSKKKSHRPVNNPEAFKKAISFFKFQPYSELPASSTDKINDNHTDSQSVIQKKEKPYSVNGTGMPDAVKGKMEVAFNTDFSNVKIHSNSEQSKQMGALAYTKGSDVHFAPGQYNPHTQCGQELLGHELTHVVQQRAGRVQATTQGKGMDINDNQGLENEANELGRKAAHGGKNFIQRKNYGSIENKHLNRTVQRSAASATLGLTGSVGLNCANNVIDIEKVKQKLIDYGFLSNTETNIFSTTPSYMGFLNQQEQPISFTNGSQIVSSSNNNLIFEAIGKFQKDVVREKKPDKKITPNGATDRALTTYYTKVKTADDYMAIKTALNADFKINPVAANSNFSTAMRGETINNSSKAETINLNALMVLRIRLNQFTQNLNNNTLSLIKGKPYNDIQKKTINDAITETIKELKNVQRIYSSPGHNNIGNPHGKDIKWWSENKKVTDDKTYLLTQTTAKASYTEGEIMDGDATFIYLRDFKEYKLNWKSVDGQNRKVQVSNFVKAKGITNYTEGISYAGELKPDNFNAQDYQNAANIDEHRRKSLVAASGNEGGFDAINTYDQAKISFGFIQFAGGNRSFEFLLAKIKNADPSTFQNCFSKYGIDVEYKTDANNKIMNDHTARIILHDPQNNKSYRGLEAEDVLRKNPVYAAVLMKAAESNVVRNIQLKVSKEMYMDPSENSQVQFKVQAIIITDGGIGGPSVNENEQSIADYKLTADYATNLRTGHIIEINLTDLSGIKLGDILQSEKERASLYGTYINSPKISLSAFRSAIRAIIIKERLTSIAQVKEIAPIDLLNKAREKSTSEDHKSRIKKAIDSNTLQ